MTKEERQEKVRWLSRYKILENQIERLESKRQRFVDRLYKITTVPTGMPQGNNPSGYAEILSEIDEIIRDIVKRISEQADACVEIEKAIRGIKDERLVLLLEYRYIDCLKWEEICVKMNCAWDTVHRWHGKALEEINVRTQSYT